MTRIDYYKYIKSPEWFARTEHVRKRNNGKCECCNMRFGKVVHHRTYSRLGNEFELDLFFVCKECHKMIHKKGEYYIWPSRLKLLRELQIEIAKELNSERDL